MKTRIRPLAVAALALAFTLPGLAADKLSAELAQSLAAGSAGSVMAGESLAADYPALAWLPCTEFITLNDLSGLAARLNKSGQPLPPAVVALESFALGTDSANAPLLSAITSLVQTLSLGEPTLDDAAGKLAEHALKPVWAVLTCKPGQEAVLHQLADSVAKAPFLRPAAPLPAGFSGGRIDWQSLTPEDEHHRAHSGVRTFQQKHQPYILTQVRENALFIIVCGKPEDIELPKHPLKGSGLMDAQPHLKAGARGQKALGALHLSADFLRQMQKESCDSSIDTLRQLDDTSGGSLPVISKLISYTRSFADSPVRHPLVIQGWQDKGGLSFTCSVDAMGLVFKPGKFPLLSYADKPDTILYAESTPCEQSDKTKPGLMELFMAGLELGASGLFAQTDEPGAASRADVTALSHGIADALGTMSEGLDGRFAVVMDDKGAAPAAFGLPEATSIPRLGVYLGVAKRALLSKGWDRLEESLAAAGSSMKDLPIDSKSSGKVTRYSIDTPLFTKDFMPNLIVTDKHLAMGSSAPLNITMLKAAGKKKATTGAGAVFVFRAKPFATCLGNLLMSSSADGPTSIFVGEQPAEAALDKFAGTIDTIHGAATVEEGVYTLKVRVDFAR